MRPQAAARIYLPSGRLLLIQRVLDDRWAAGCWTLPGGKVDEGEQACEAAAREISEEVGLVVHPLELVRTLQCGPDKIPTSVYRGRVHAAVHVALGSEAVGFGWFFPDALPPDLAPGVRECLI